MHVSRDQSLCDASEVTPPGTTLVEQAHRVLLLGHVVPGLAPQATDALDGLQRIGCSFLTGRRHRPRLRILKSKGSCVLVIRPSVEFVGSDLVESNDLSLNANH